MDKLVIRGGNRLHGEVQVAGAKNAALPLMAASILSGGVTKLSNVPDLVDIRTFSSVLAHLGVEISATDHRLELDASNINNDEAPYDMVRKMRASVYVLGALLGRFGKARVSLPGGCAWGPRPVDIHLKGLKALGADIDIDRGYIVASAKKLKGASFYLDFPSVGATVNLLLAASCAEGKTKLENVAREPEIVNLVRMLQKMGVEINGEGTPTLSIVGSNNLAAVEMEVIPDRIEAGTYLVAAGLTGGKIHLKGASAEQMSLILVRAAEAGIKTTTTQDGIIVERTGELHPVDVETAVYPGFPTDMQAQWIVLMTAAKGVSLIEDTIYPDRFTHVAELTRLGAVISMKENIARVSGGNTLIGAPVMSTDLRASASLVLAALNAEGETHIRRIYHLDRGYEALEKKFEALGANIKREQDK
ncbi:UDP-N-acetylglucosamine 1-carboxyvinyltransferase [bacterium]|nr:UDP-N-acetylglucosamine 1-carboxyvinyltransferase [bacterium]